MTELTKLIAIQKGEMSLELALVGVWLQERLSQQKRYQLPRRNRDYHKLNKIRHREQGRAEQWRRECDVWKRAFLEREKQLNAVLESEQEFKEQYSLQTVVVDRYQQRQQQWLQEQVQLYTRHLQNGGWGRN
ncbi:hypothetical protein [Gimesia panareensis]|uniref:hypothetical protein n=1 Tax=Gimesia panareensis TaxID=2527978 RepID=UPI00118B70AF|nr:hypothetical protein [Gimesia panareensis]QDU52116.1 hypothetical protein Pan110_44880 [Gimesia panareensis]